MNNNFVLRPIGSVFLLVAGFFAFLCLTEFNSALAQVNESPGSCSVTLRVIKGSGNDNALKGVAPKVGNYLKDIKGQLQPIPYRSFKVLGDDKKYTALGSQASFAVSDAAGERHKLSVVPVDIVNKLVTLKVDWTSPSSESLLATKVDVENGKNVVVGTDTRPGVSTIISIGVRCQ